MIDRKNFAIACIIGISSFVLYSAMAARGYTWLFVSGDSGDWLAASNLWVVPQPYGSPLYITLGHLINLLPGSLSSNMTLLLSALPSAITASVVYLIAVHLSGKQTTGIIASLALLASGVFLTQSTVLEEYALAVMFVVLAFYFYLLDRKLLTIIMLGLGSAIHIVPVILTALWAFLLRKEGREWVRLIPIYLLVGIAPYFLIVGLMATHNPPFLAGYGLSWQAINAYLGSTGVFGSLSIFDFPERLLQFGSIILMSFGIAVIPAILFFKKRPWQSWQKLMFISIFFPIWYYLTCLDPTSWTFMTYACPFIAIAAALGLSQLNWKPALLGITSIIIILANLLFLNASILSKDYPNAQEYLAEVQAIPDGSAVVMNRGGFEAMAVYYAISEGKNLIPLFITENPERALYTNYLQWLYDNYSITGNSTQEIALASLNEYSTYCMTNLPQKWQPAFQVEDTELEWFGKLKGVNIEYSVPKENSLH